MRATHIVGAELFYECTNPNTNTYSVTLKLYRDCLNGQAPFDAQISLFVFNGTSGLIEQTKTVLAPSQTPQINPNSYGPCVATPPQICVEEGIYTTTLVLPPTPGGYDIAWARCCRNQAIDNLVNPLGAGITFLASVPSPDQIGACNSMPQFDQVPPIFLCVNEAFSFDHSATDPDGDSLVYFLTNPYTGLNSIGQGAGNPQQGGNDPTVDPFNNLMGPPPYQNVIFANGFSFTNPFGSNNFSLDPLTGFINVTPNQTGIFVFSVSVFEYRNGVLLSENRRDFQIHVIQCLDQDDPPFISHTFAPNLNTSGDTIIIPGGESFCYDVLLEDTVLTDSVIPFTVSAAFGNGPFFPPAAVFTTTYVGTAVVQGEVCWEPACEYAGQTLSLIVGGRDPDDCVTIADIFDTVWVRILPNVNLPPTITPTYTGLNVSNDTIIIDANDQLCYDLTVNDPDQFDDLTLVGLSPIFSGANPPVLTTSGSNPVNGQLCWTPGCDFEGQTIEIAVRAEDFADCKPSDFAFNTTYVRIIAPPNDPPTINSTLTGNVFNGDTIFVNAEENLCFDFLSVDPNTGDTLNFIPFSPIFGQPNGPSFTTNGLNPLDGEICWTPGCTFENQLVPLIFGAEDQGQCSNLQEVFDTVFVFVQVPPNDAPLIASDLTNLVTNGDTIIVDANQAFCYNYQASDINVGDLLAASALSPIFNAPDGPSFTSNGSNPINGQICWTPTCDYAGQTIPLIIGVDDDAACSAQASNFDTVYVRIDVPPNDAPVSSHLLPATNVVNDTIYVDANEPVCYDIIFNDPNLGDSLNSFTVSDIFTGTNAATFTVNGINPLNGQVCWTPTCDNEGQLIELIVGVEDNGQCDNVLQAFDTVYIRINDPVTVPPEVGHNLPSNLNVRNDTIFLEVGDSACYDFFVRDLTPAPSKGIDYEFSFEDQFGNSLPITEFGVVEQNDSIFGSICFFANCFRGGTTFRSIISGIDEETCPPFKRRNDTIFIRVQTDFKSFAGRDTFFCEGTGGIELGVSPIGGDAPYFYQWFCDDPGNCGFTPNGNQQNPIVNPNQPTTYSVQLTDSRGCTSEFDDIVIAPAAIPIVDAGPDTFYCEGGVGVRLNGNIMNGGEAPGPYTYEWFPAQGLNSTTTNNPFARPDTTTIYTLVVTDANGCSSLRSTIDPLSTVGVDVRPKPNVDAGPDIDLCLGDSLSLTGFADGAGPDYSYIWTPATGVTDSSSQSTKVSPDKTTTYFFISFSNGCRSVADSTTVIVHTKPTVAQVGPFEICATDSVELRAIASGDPDATEYSYAWSPGFTLSDSTISNPFASPDFTTNYILTATSNFGCGSEAQTVPVVVRSTPFVDLLPDTSICEGDTLTLTSVLTRLGGATTEPTFYSWSPDDALESPLSRVTLAQPSTTTKYILTSQTGSCATQDSVVIEVFPALQGFAFADTTRICSNDSLQLFAQGGYGSETYEWTPNFGLSDPNIPNPMASPDSSLTYLVTITEGECIEELSIPINVLPAPKVDFVNSQGTGCDELEVFFSVVGEDAIAYVWDFGDGSPISNVAAPSHTYADTGKYEVTLIATGVAGCETVITKQAIEVLESGNADFTTLPDLNEIIIIPNTEVAFFNASSGAVEFYWEFGDGAVSREENPVHTYTTPGRYQVKLVIVDEGGCIDEIMKGFIIVELPGITIPTVFSPNGDGANDVYQVVYNGEEDFSLEIFDRWGRAMSEVIQNPADSWDGVTKDGLEASEGVYYYLVRIGDRSYNGHLTLLR